MPCIWYIYLFCLPDDDEDCDMDDDFRLTASQLNMIEINEAGHFRGTKEAKTNSYQQTETCSRTHFGLDSVTVEIIDQLCYIRYVTIK